MDKTTWNPNLYNDKHAFVYQYGESLIELLAPQPGDLILDLGCGSGQLAAKIKKLGAAVTGIDMSKNMIQDAKSKYPEIGFHVMDAVGFTFPQPFDAIFSNAVLHWVLEKEAVIDSMFENLRVGGRIVLEFGGKGNVEAIINALKKNLRKKGFEKNADIDLWYFPSISEYTSLLEKRGFEVTFAQLYDRPTLLADSEDGIKDWIRMFGMAFFDNVHSERVENILTEVQEDIRGQCFQEGNWYADYRRIRIVAFKRQANQD